jgi:hypothetical protein
MAKVISSDLLEEMAKCLHTDTAAHVGERRPSFWDADASFLNTVCCCPYGWTLLLSPTLTCPSPLKKKNLCQQISCSKLLVFNCVGLLCDQILLVLDLATEFCGLVFEALQPVQDLLEIFRSDLEASHRHCGPCR